MSGRMRIFWLIFAVLFAALAGIGCVYAQLFGSAYIQPGGSPAETVTRFFDSVQNGDYPAAYSCLSDYTSLGLEEEAESPEAAMLLDALHSSYRYTLKGDSRVNGLEATQKVTFRYLNLKRTESAIADRVNGVLEEMIEGMQRTEIYDENGGYRQSLTDAVYAAALEQVLQNPDSLCVETELEIPLRYLNGTWLMSTDRSLMTALMGGAG
ncbi:MAG: hypothetical protein IJQ02_06315 [Oscillospiraceae bacterium]|nr:hypothetical protein [Oscillospiraceae bacterium]